MRERLQIRLETLRAEYEKGKATLDDLESKVSNVRATMFRISGAIQVLEELLAGAPDLDHGSTGHVDGAQNGQSTQATGVEGSAPPSLPSNSA